MTSSFSPAFSSGGDLHRRTHKPTDETFIRLEENTSMPALITDERGASGGQTNMHTTFGDKEFSKATQHATLQPIEVPCDTASLPRQIKKNSSQPNVPTAERKQLAPEAGYPEDSQQQKSVTSVNYFPSQLSNSPLER